MSSVPFVVVGTVVLDTVGRGAVDGTVCLTTGDDLVDRAEIAEDGSFLIETSVESGTYYVSAFAGGFDGRRRRLVVAGTPPVSHDAGEFRLCVCELTPGIHGQLWDQLDDRPVSTGLVSLHRGDDLLASRVVSGGGGFSFVMNFSLPMPPGAYRVVTSVPGYADQSIPLAVVDHPTIYQLGRVELTSPRFDSNR